ncbi:uncharacterized protein [Drosophila pseudoobscura]|uniref:PiggyBac transposable element-derived protein domain-containing protein n=1 Tax=Drosophila pseudoobscura pseudoobscura TaxID=46245 RepID=A0A6I8UW76_DROPS|nr:uncharacterized protein LOC4805468 [Drosophila pseudoobscura]
MEYAVDEEYLTDIKCSEDEDDDEDMQETDDLPEGDDSPPPWNAEDSDPLQVTADADPFPWLFEENDILINEDELDQVVATPAESGGAVVKRGRGRPSLKVFFKSASGQRWSADRTAAAEEPPLLVHEACGKGPAVTVSNAVESWILLFDDEMMRFLVRHVNEQFRKRTAQSLHQRQIDVVEMRSFLGLTYLCGVFRNGQFNGPLDELWTVELGNAIFRATMTFQRFEYISESLSEINSWAEGKKLWHRLIINSRTYYGCSSWITVDDVPCSVADATLALCCDAKTLYMANASATTQPQSIHKEVEKLICDYKTTGRNVTLGSRYLSLSQCQELMESQLSSIGLMETTAADWPKLWPCGSTVYNRSSKLVPHEKKALLCCGLISEVDAVKLFRHTEQTCHQFYEHSQRYSTKFATPASLEKESHTFLNLLHLVLNTAAFNAWILLRLSLKGDARMEQRDFQRQLGLFLSQQRLQRRLQRRSTTTTLGMRLQICEILGQSTQRLISEVCGEAKRSQDVGVISLEKAALPQGVSLCSRYGDKHRRCKPCSKDKRETKARSRCQQCQAHRCGNHLISRCYECMGLQPAQLPEGNLPDATDI